VGERDLFGVGFSDNVVFRKQYYVRAVAGGPENLSASLNGITLYLYTDERFADDTPGEPLVYADGRWLFSIQGTEFEAQLGLSLEQVGTASV
jgi:hypothetical protein